MRDSGGRAYLGTTIDLTVVGIVEPVRAKADPVFHDILLWRIPPLSGDARHVHNVTQVQGEVLAEVLILCRPCTPTFLL